MGVKYRLWEVDGTQIGDGLVVQQRVMLIHGLI